MSFIDRVENLLGMYESSIYKYCTKYILDLRKTESTLLINSNDMKSGGIYQIKYDYGGLNQYKFVLCLENSKSLNENRKFLIWCLNIMDMTRDQRKFFFGNFFNEQIVKNEEFDNALIEPLFNFQPNEIYQYLKQIGHNYIIEPYSLNDIKEIKRVSTNILEYVIFFENSKTNFKFLKIIRDKLNEQNGVQSDIKNKIQELLEKYKELLDVYEDNSLDYHKQLKYFENNIKLYEKQ
jgi:hypothetical protein